MNIKNAILVIAITTIFGNNIINTQELPEPHNAEQERQTAQEEINRILSEQQRRIIQGLPRDPTKTPTSPDVIDDNRQLERKGIYYGKDSFGKPCYRRIWQH